MVAPDPVDARLLATIAEMGRAAVHEVAARLGMDPREAAARLVALSGSGLPLLVGVECDPQGVRTALANAAAWGSFSGPAQGQQYGPQPGYGTGPVPGPGQGVPGQGVHGTPSGAYPTRGTPSGPYQTGTPSGPYPAATPSGPYGTPSGPYPAGSQSGPYPTGAPSGPQPAPPAGYPGGWNAPPQGDGGGYGAQQPASGPVPAQGFTPPPAQSPTQQTPAQQSPPPTPAPSPVPVAAAPTAPAGPAPEAVSTWGPPQSSSWARGDQQTFGATAPATTPAANTAAATASAATAPATGTGTAGTSTAHPPVGSAQETEGLEGERLSIQLVEVVDPADYLFTAAGYRLREGERSVVVHTELTNKGPGAFGYLPDLYLVLVTDDGTAIAKAPVSLSSRPPHRIGVRPGETAGGHTVYVLPEDTRVTAVRWSARPDDDRNALTWTVDL